MHLQIALDRMPLERAVDLTCRLAPAADVIEVGTSLVKAHGMTAVRSVVEAAGETAVLADLKTADDADTEFAMAFAAGARAATVLGCVEDATLRAALACADRHGAETVVDLMATTEQRRADLAAALPDRVVLAAHVAKDARSSAAAVTALLGPWSTGRRLAVAGGLTAADVVGFADLPDVRIIVGSAVTAAPDPEEACRALAAAMAPYRTAVAR